MSRELLNRLRLPVVAAPMFLVSGPDMVIAAARAGIVGAFPTPNCRTTEQVDEWMTRIVAETADADQLQAIAVWADMTDTGDRADLPIQPNDFSSDKV